MRILVVYTHPNPRSFNHAILEVVEKEIRGLGHEIQVRDLYQSGFDPVLSGSDLGAIHQGKIPDPIRQEQEYILWADVIIFIHPIWWTGLPALLKGYIDRVFSYGFAYVFGKDGPQGLLTGKKVVIINTTGSPSDHYDQAGLTDALRKTSDVGIYQFCGFDVMGHIFLGAVPAVTDEVRRRYLKDVEEKIRMLFQA